MDVSDPAMPVEPLRTGWRRSCGPLGRTGLVVRGRLTVPPRRAAASGLHEVVVLAEPLVDSPAHRSGVRADDLLFMVDGRLVRSARHTCRSIGKWRSGEVHRVYLVRGDRAVLVDLLV